MSRFSFKVIMFTVFLSLLLPFQSNVTPAVSDADEPGSPPEVNRSTHDSAFIASVVFPAERKKKHGSLGPLLKNSSLITVPEEERRRLQQCVFGPDGTQYCEYCDYSLGELVCAVIACQRTFCWCQDMGQPGGYSCYACSYCTSGLLAYDCSNIVDRVGFCGSRTCTGQLYDCNYVSGPEPNPTPRPTNNPTRRPTRNPTLRPTHRPTRLPTRYPTRDPTLRPTYRPTRWPTRYPTRSPTRNPTNRPSPNPTQRPNPLPTLRPSPNPTTSRRPPNDACFGAESVTRFVYGSTIGASIDNSGSCGVSVTAPGVWYEVRGTGRQMPVDTCGTSTNFDTKISVFRGTCSTLICIDGNDDACGTKSTVTWDSTRGLQYKILIHGYSSATGDFRLGVSSSTQNPTARPTPNPTQKPNPMPTPRPTTKPTSHPTNPPRPENDVCADAFSVTRFVFGSTRGASIDSRGRCGVSVTAPGVWYTVQGTGGEMIVDTCSGSTTFDSQISVFRGTCSSLICIDGNDDDCGNKSAVTWNSVRNVEYKVLVHGYSSATGDFRLVVSYAPLATPPDADPTLSPTPVHTQNSKLTAEPTMFEAGSLTATPTTDLTVEKVKNDASFCPTLYNHSALNDDHCCNLPSEKRQCGERSFCFALMLSHQDSVFSVCCDAYEGCQEVRDLFKAQDVVLKLSITDFALCCAILTFLLFGLLCQKRYKRYIRIMIFFEVLALAIDISIISIIRRSSAIDTAQQIIDAECFTGARDPQRIGDLIDELETFENVAFAEAFIEIVVIIIHIFELCRYEDLKDDAIAKILAILGFCFDAAELVLAGIGLFAYLIPAIEGFQELYESLERSPYVDTFGNEESFPCIFRCCGSSLG